MMRTPFWILSFVLAFEAGCLVEAEPHQTPSSISELTDKSALPEKVIDRKGVSFLRLDLWDSADLERMRERRQVPEGERPTIEATAEGLRALMRHSNGGIYIQEMPDYEVAAQVLADGDRGDRRAASTSAGEGLSARRVIGTDTRSNVSSSGQSWQAKTAFGEHGASATRIGANTAVTAAHAVFNTMVQPDKPQGWICRDGSTNPNGCASYPRWRFGVDGINGNSNWVSCEHVFISTSFIDLTSNSPESFAWTYARHDYAVLDLSDCPPSTWPNGTSWMGTIDLDAADLLDLTANAVGYPALVPCPAGSQGSSYTECSGGSLQYIGATPSFVGAELFQASSSSVAPGDSEPEFTIRCLADVTQGQSGGALYNPIDMRLVGILSNAAVADSNENRYRRWTTSLFNWVASHSEFPDDT